MFLFRALTMPEDERTLRMNHLRRRERIHDVNHWMKSFLKAMDSLEEERDDIGATTMHPVTIDDFDDYLSKWVPHFFRYHKSSPSIFVFKRILTLIQQSQITIFLVLMLPYLCRYIGHTHKLALLLDYDGTLAPIAPHPDLATLPFETKNILQRLSNLSDVYIAIVSGRNVDNVRNMVSHASIIYIINSQFHKKPKMCVCFFVNNIISIF